MANYRIPCHKCGGSGFANGSWNWAKKTCDVCNGDGYVEQTNVVVAPIITTHDDSADDVLRHTIGQLDSVVIVGHTKDGHEFYASSVADGGSALWLMQRGIHNLMNIVDKDTDE